MGGLLAALRAAAEPTRLRIIALLSGGELTVTELVESLGQSQPRVSRHLKILAEARILTRYREGSLVFLRLADLTTFNGAHPAIDLASQLVKLLPITKTGERDLNRLAAVKLARDKKTAAYFSKIAEHWDNLGSLHVDDQKVEAVISQWLGQTAILSLLDIGTGTGRILEFLSPNAVRSFGVDQSREMVVFARSKLEKAGCINCQVRKGDLYRLPFTDSSFDAAVIHQVLHFLDDPEAAIIEAARVISLGGRLLVIDFLPHLLENVANEQNHRHLGFLEEKIFTWFRSAGLIPINAKSLAGPSLTVGIWMAKKPEFKHT